MTSAERQLEEQLIAKLLDLKYEHRPDIRDRAALERNFREKFEALNRVRLSDGEFQRLLDEIVTPDVFTAALTLRNRNSFTRDDGTPLNYTLVNTAGWCKNTFEVVNLLRINTDYSHHRYDVLLLIGGVPVAQIELTTLGINPRRAIEQDQVPITAQRKLLLQHPKPAEQQRIADCLGSLDACLAAEAEKLATLKIHKKGLMQQLFPSPEGTGDSLARRQYCE